MKITWSLPVRGLSLDAHRGDVVRARNLIEALRHDGHEVIVVEDVSRVGSAATVAFFRQAVRRMLPRKLALVARDLGRWLHGRLHGARVATAAERQGAELLIETQVAFAGSGALAARRTGLPLVLDDCSPNLEERLLGAGLPALAGRVLLGQMRAASQIIAVSEAAARKLAAEGAPPEKIRLVPNGVDERAYLGAARRDEVRRELGLDGFIVVGFAGSFQPWHDVALLMEAVRSMNEGLVRILLVGDGPGLRPALARAEKLGVLPPVRAIGEVPAPRIPSLVSAFDIGVLPGTNDYGHPMKLVEYAAAGVPSVAPDVAPVREVIEHGVSGLLFPSGDASRLASALAELARDEELRRRLGRKAKDALARRGSWRSRARSLLPETAFRRAVS